MQTREHSCSKRKCPTGRVEGPSLDPTFVPAFGCLVCRSMQWHMDALIETGGQVPQRKQLAPLSDNVAVRDGLSFTIRVWSSIRFSIFSIRH